MHFLVKGAAGVLMASSFMLAAGCGQDVASTRGSVELQSLKASDTHGNLEIRLAPVARYSVLATLADVATIKVTLKGAALGGEQTRVVDAALMRPGAKGHITFLSLPAGPVDVEIFAFDSTGAQIGEAIGSAEIFAGKSTNAHFILKLKDKHIPNPNGHLAVHIGVQDGAEIVDPIDSPQPEVDFPPLDAGGMYDITSSKSIPDSPEPTYMYIFAHRYDENGNWIAINPIIGPERLGHGTVSLRAWSQNSNDPQWPVEYHLDGTYVNSLGVTVSIPPEKQPWSAKYVSDKTYTGPVQFVYASSKEAAEKLAAAAK